MNINNLHEVYKYNKKKKFKFHMPGNFGGSELSPEFVKNMPLFETTEIDKMDDYHAPDGIIKEAEIELSKVFNSKKSIFLVNGSTSGIIAAMSYLFRKGDNVLISRDSHKSVQYGLVISGAKPIYLTNRQHEGYKVLLPPTYEDIAQEIKNNDKIKGLIITSPNYYGIGTKDLEKISKFCLEQNIKLLLDEAHGSHLYFTPFKRFLGNHSKCDIVVNSFHKNLNGLTQTAMIHLNNEEILLEDFRKHVSLVTTTSPSYLLLSSMAYSLTRYKEKGQKILHINEKKVKYMKDLLDEYKIKYIRGEKLRSYYLDPTKVTIVFEKSSVAARVYKNLIKLQVYPEMIVDSKIVFFINLGIKLQDIKRTVKIISLAIRRVKGKSLSKGTKILKPEIKNENRYQTKAILTPREAFYSEKDKVSVENAIGRVAIDIITTYPPGIPLVMPGEEITKDIVEYLKGTYSSVHGVKNGIIEVVK